MVEQQEAQLEVEELAQQVSDTTDHQTHGPDVFGVQLHQIALEDYYYYVVGDMHHWNGNIEVKLLLDWILDFIDYPEYKGTEYKTSWQQELYAKRISHDSNRKSQ